MKTNESLPTQQVWKNYQFCCACSITWWVIWSSSLARSWRDSSKTCSLESQSTPILGWVFGFIYFNSSLSLSLSLSLSIYIYIYILVIFIKIWLHNVPYINFRSWNIKKLSFNITTISQSIIIQPTKY